MSSLDSLQNMCRNQHATFIPVPFDNFGHQCRITPLNQLVRYLQQTKSGPVWLRTDLSPHDKNIQKQDVQVTNSIDDII